MKPSDVLLSIVLHASIVAGVMYGLSHYQDAPKTDAEIEPIFFEILEESVIASTSQPQPTTSVPTPAEPAPAEPKSEFESESDFEAEKGTPELENMVRTEFSEVKGSELENRRIDENKAEKRENSEKAEEKKVKEAEGNNRENKEEENTDENMVREQDNAETADVQHAKVVSAPTALNRIVPVYPRSARRRGREGVVAIEILVSGSGSVSKAEVVGTSGCSDLDAAAVTAVKTARFAPATEDGVQVEGRLRLTFEFRLK